MIGNSNMETFKLAHKIQNKTLGISHHLWALSSSQRLQYLKMPSATLSLIPLPLNSNNYPIFLLPVKNLQPQSLGQNPKRLRLSAKFSSVSGDHHPAPSLPAGHILRKLAVSSVILLGLGLSRCAFACTPIPPPVVQSGDHHVIEGSLWFYFGFVDMFTYFCSFPGLALSETELVAFSVVTYKYFQLHLSVSSSVYFSPLFMSQRYANSYMEMREY